MVPGAGAERIAASVTLIVRWMWAAAAAAQIVHGDGVKLPQVVQHPAKLAREFVAVVVLGRGRRAERRFAHVAQRRDAARTRGVLDARPLVSGPASRLRMVRRGRVTLLPFL